MNMKDLDTKRLPIFQVQTQTLREKQMLQSNRFECFFLKGKRLGWRNGSLLQDLEAKADLEVVPDTYRLLESCAPSRGRILL